MPWTARREAEQEYNSSLRASRVALGAEGGSLPSEKTIDTLTQGLNEALTKLRLV